MAMPDFSRPTVDILARRAGFQCSNPDCGVQTVGPNTDPGKATIIGEAAHIMGARPGTARYDVSMSNTTRASVTNGIWLCRNCHVKIDRDEEKYSTDLLFSWRKDHEERMLHELGTRGDRMRYKTELRHLEFLSNHPAIIELIAIDKPPGWEWRLTAELMRYLNGPELKKLKNLRNGLYFCHVPSVRQGEYLEWVTDRVHVMSSVLKPIAGLLDRLKASWGEPGEPGSAEEIHDTCVLLHNMLGTIVEHEQMLRLPKIPEEGEEIRSMLLDVIGRNAEKLEELPTLLEEVVAMIDTEHGGTVEQPLITTWKWAVEIPEGLNDRLDEALLRYQRSVMLP